MPMALLACANERFVGYKRLRRGHKYAQQRSKCIVLYENQDYNMDATL